MPRRFLSPSPSPGPSRFFLYAEAAILLILSISLLSSYLKQYPILSQTGGSLMETADGLQPAQESHRAPSQEAAQEPSQAPSQEAALEDEPKDGEPGEKKFIKWVDFSVTNEAMTKAFRLDMDTCQAKLHFNWIELLAYLGAKYGGDFSRYKASDMDALTQKLTEGSTMDDLTKDMGYYPYYLEAYSAVLGGMVGTFQAEIDAQLLPEDSPYRTDGQETDRGTIWVTKYGLKAFSPVAKGFPYSDFDDFGTARSYGFKRQHLGHDMMGQVGTPIIAVESGTVEALGWNQYGGWRIGIRSFDQKRYYYYAHLRKNYPYQSGLEVGSQVQAGDVIGYMGRTGYSRTENTNNIDESHLHFGLQLIFDESQKEGNNEIWVSCYELVKFLRQNQCLTEKTPDTKEWHRVYGTQDF